MMVRPAVWSETESLVGTYSDMYDRKRNEVHQVPLANWSTNDVFRQVYLPSRQEQLRYIDSLVEGLGDDDRAGLAWGAFGATGCTPGQSFRIEFIWNFEINSSTLTTGRRRAPSNRGFDVIAAARPHLPPHVENRDPTVENEAPSIVANRPLELAKVASAVYGPTKASNFLRTISQGAARVLVGGRMVAQRIGEGMKLIGPALAAMAPMALKMFANSRGRGRGRAGQGGRPLLSLLR